MKLKVLCIHSLTAHGTVGLKTFVSVLRERVVAVPSLLLTGTGDVNTHRRFNYDFGGMLDGAFRHAAERDERLVVFVGYLADATQVETILAALVVHRARIEAVVIDPVSGDDGRLYVSRELLAEWPKLLAEADWGLPNVTEMELLTGSLGEEAVKDLRVRFPTTNWLVTGWIASESIETRLYLDGRETRHSQPWIARRFNGTGDLFAAVWVRELFFEHKDPSEAMGIAAGAVAAAIRRSVEQGETGLVLSEM